MKTKKELMEQMNSELEDFVEKMQPTTEDKCKLNILSMIYEHFDNNYNDENNVIIEKIAEYEQPLETLYEIFVSYIDIDRVQTKVFEDFFIKGQSHRELVKECVFCDQFYDEDEYCDDDYDLDELEEDDEGFIYDNEDC